MKKSQVSTEFLVFVGIAMVVLMVYLGISTIYSNITATRKDNIAAQNLLEEIRNEINLAARVENGYTKKITLQNNINAKDYEMRIGGREIYIRFEGNDFAKLLATDVSNEPITFIPGNSYIIKKENDEVTIL